MDWRVLNLEAEQTHRELMIFAGCFTWTHLNIISYIIPYRRP